MHHGRDREKNDNFTFPTGHPLLGTGRIVKSVWCNRSGESCKPYDFKVHVEVECDSSRWEDLINNLSNELSENIVRIIRRPHIQQKSSTSNKGLLLVGPIFIEVKSTIDSRHSHDEDRRNSTSSRTDLFEISSHEILFATRYVWRYHLLRVIWNNDAKQAIDKMNLSITPQIIHVPSLTGVLQQNSMKLQMCIAMLHGK
ncbi:hypothetical protein MN116_000545 [Schistosoma mekongi]|uniref:Uncharacterized protein n=1 Tax=Schistosoma mekongi TaxID=38744 RepID=A0AAE1ZB50_SCHME|nr:hypothetical protein MN116_000545 [Schistosoma mekongi]